MTRDDTIMHVDWWTIKRYVDESGKKYKATWALAYITDDGDFIKPIHKSHGTIYDLHMRLVKQLNSQL